MTDIDLIRVATQNADYLIPETLDVVKAESRKRVFNEK